MHSSIDPGITAVAAHLQEGDGPRHITGIPGDIAEGGPDGAVGTLRPLRVGFVSKLFADKVNQLNVRVGEGRLLRGGRLTPLYRADLPRRATSVRNTYNACLKLES